MTTDPETERRAYPRENAQHWINITAEDIPPGWIDDMVKRLFEELNRQMIRMENASKRAPEKKDASGNEIDDPDAREKNARTLARIQTQLERLTAMEAARAPARKSKRNEKPGEIRARLAQRLTLQIESSRARLLLGKPGQ